MTKDERLQQFAQFLNNYDEPIHPSVRLLVWAAFNRGYDEGLEDGEPRSED